jgi:tetrapyrrole methylase family protein/MazG family protein
MVRREESVFLRVEQRRITLTAGITIVGLGPGDPELITRQAWAALSEAQEVFLRTGSHGAATGLPTHLEIHTFDTVYEETEGFEDVYRKIVDRLLELGRRPQGVVYAVPGDPTVGEATVPDLQRAAASAGLPVRLVHGVSFVEPCLAAAGLDALDGLQITDALDLAGQHHPRLDPDRPALIGQLYSQLVASDVKLSLLRQYPAEHEVLLVAADGSAGAQVDRRPLHDLDRRQDFRITTSLMVPPRSSTSSFEGFQEIIAHLRAPEGCPWDREQTHESLRPHLLEETYEALQAIDEDDMVGLREELGDLLLQVVIQAEIATEFGEFTMAEVIADIAAKLLRRHPHVFGDVKVAGVEEVLHNWEGLKAAERDAGGEGKGLLDGVPVSLPGLAQALEIQGRVARVGFDWPDEEGARRKVFEELSEVATATTEERRADELGDVLFAVVNYARKLGVDAEAALRHSNRRFRGRFAAMERAAAEQGKPLEGMAPGDLDALWESAKGDEA